MSPSIPQPAEPLSPERLAEIKESQPGDWLAGKWTSRMGVQMDRYLVVHEDGTVLAELPDWAGPLALFIADAHDAVPALLAENERLNGELAKYVGHEPTIAEEMQYLSRENERLTARVAELEGTQEAASLALPWAHRMSDDDLHLFLNDLVSAAIDRWRSAPSVPDRQILATVEKVCANWRTPGQGYRSDDPEKCPKFVGDGDLCLACGDARRWHRDTEAGAR